MDPYFGPSDAYYDPPEPPDVDEDPDADDREPDEGWYEDWQAQWDDDPNPYHGTYSEE